MQSVAAAPERVSQGLPKGTDSYHWGQDSGWPTEASISPRVAEPFFLLEEIKKKFSPPNLKETSFPVQLEII